MRSAVSRASRSSTARTGTSVRSSRTYVSRLERQLNQEKVARERLEQQVEELRLISSQISSRFGMANPGASYNP